LFRKVESDIGLLIKAFFHSLLCYNLRHLVVLFYFRRRRCHHDFLIMMMVVVQVLQMTAVEVVVVMIVVVVVVLNPTYSSNLTILTKLSAFREAPPTSAPSMSGSRIRSSTLSGLTLPP